MLGPYARFHNAQQNHTTHWTLRQRPSHGGGLAGVQAITHKGNKARHLVVAKPLLGRTKTVVLT